MKNLIRTTILILLLLSSFSSFSQSIGEIWECNTDAPKSKTMYVNTNESSFNTYIKHIRIFVHVIRKDNGTGGLSSEVVNNSLSILKDDYQQHNISFIEIGRDFIDSDLFYNGINKESYFQLINTGNHDSAIDIYFLSSTDKFARASNIPGNALALGGYYTETSVLSHEMGHCLGLYHTHSGRGCNDYENCQESIDSSNCDECGDLVCDTPADPCLKGKVDKDCNYIGGGGFSPNTDNIMSYSPPYCLSAFTNGQKERIHAAITSEPVLKKVIVLSPTNLTATNIRYRDFTLSWTGVDNAVGYKVYDVTNSKEKLVGTTTETKLAIKDLGMGETYKYAVKAKYPNIESEYSDTLSVTTVKLKLSGATTICDQETYTIENFLPNTKVEWKSINSNLELVSVTENGKKATFSKKGNGICLVNVHFKDIQIVLHKEVMVGVPLSSEIGVYINGETVGKVPYTILSDFDFPKLRPYPDLVTLCTSKDNLFYAEYPKKTGSSLYGNIFLPSEFIDLIDFRFIGLKYEWRVKEGNPDWTLESKYPHFPSLIDNSAIVAKYFKMLEPIIKRPYSLLPPPVFEVRLCNECGCSEWKELSNFEVRECSIWDLIFLLTPNGDGVNDTFEITETAKPTTYSTSTTDRVYNLTIFNNEGNVVYEKDNYMQDDERFVGIGNTGNYANVTLSGGNYYYTLTGSSNRSGMIYLERE